MKAANSEVVLPPPFFSSSSPCLRPSLKRCRCCRKWKAGTQSCVAASSPPPCLVSSYPFLVTTVTSSPSQGRRGERPAGWLSCEGAGERRGIMLCGASCLLTGRLSYPCASRHRQLVWRCGGGLGRPGFRSTKFSRCNSVHVYLELSSVEFIEAPSVYVCTGFQPHRLQSFTRFWD